MAAELTATPLLAVLVAALAALAVLTVFASLAGLSGRDLVRARLGHVDAAASGRDLELAEPFFDRVIRPVVGHLRGVADRLTSRQRLGRTELRLSRAGSPANMRPLDFVAFKLALTGGGGGAALLLPGIAGNGIVGVLLASLIVGGGLIGPELWLNRRIRTRQRRILLALPDTLDLLTISVRAGLSFDGAL
ncbi:MAG TPA: hypothetical protein VNW68_00260, partial [Candidatus Limnocylindria bacterium]|nr:hypothetical protein [Candidatus Limnocylindria bacterium]